MNCATPHAGVLRRRLGCFSLLKKFLSESLTQVGSHLSVVMIQEQSIKGFVLAIVVRINQSKTIFSEKF